MEIEPQPEQPPAPVTHRDREDAVELLQGAAEDGRLPLEEFSDRVGTALEAQTREQLTAATAGLEPAAPVGTSDATSSVVGVLGDRSQVGRWRLPGRLRAVSLMGDIHLDLRAAIVRDEVVEIFGMSLLGDLTVDVPEGVEVELTGFDLLGDRELRLAPAPRRPGTPLIRVRAYGILGDVTVRTPRDGETPPSWWSWFGRHGPHRRGRH